jgi:cytoskeletal protein CcmA (bactofilin family)
MWRKQEDPKVNSSPEVREQPRVEHSVPVAAVPVAPPAPVRAVAVPPSSHLTSTLIIKGEITGRDDLFIDGEVQGKIRLEEGKVTIGPNGRVAADVEAQEIVIRGHVKGNLNGRERVQVSSTGCATGDIATQRILVEDGAEIHGRVEIKRLEMREPQSEPALEKKKAAPVASTPVVSSPAAPVDKGVATPAPSSPTVSSPVASAKTAAEPVAAPARESAPVA